ncbi:MAG: rhomboid family intramembrane serine protease [Gammaproteobacteria bacterium]|nr:rhomboid family intramembrane serine protease [Gammaproteobacteria bacterium]MDH3372597.1 rhomboid family intramembrane serine protease [Gammaproteobacteria bacterium]MDH3552085.1 rhomboid family intramembrane serine protease [Gammaproteobacteria bacterium]
MRVVFESRNRRACSDRALVLTSLQIPYEIVDDVAGCAVIVPAEYSARAMQELRLYEQENPPRRPKVVKPFVHQNALPGVVAYVLVICAVAWLAGESYFAKDWVGAGRVDGVLVRAGEWWRTITALTLHAGLRHLLGNLVFGAFFGLFAGRLLGPGIAWLAIVLAGASGNALNTLLLESSHRSIGASTAVFAALGLLAGFVWRAKLMSQEKWPYRVGPIVGGFALLMYTGTGDGSAESNTDVGAHLMGFLCGLSGGVLLTLVRDQLVRPRWQISAAVLALLIIIVAWVVAFLA